jgi:hypothetical protein
MNAAEALVDPVHFKQIFLGHGKLLLHIVLGMQIQHDSYVFATSFYQGSTPWHNEIATKAVREKGLGSELPSPPLIQSLISVRGEIRR